MELKWPCPMLERDLPPKSSQYGTLRPTKLDKIDNLRFEVQRGALDLCQTNLIYLNEEW